MKRFFLMAAVVLCGAASFAQYTNVLENGTNLTVNSAWTNDTIWVGQTTASNTMQVISGGAVSSTNVFVGATSNANDNAVSVTGTGSWTIEDTLSIGSGTNNSVTVGNGGTVTAGNLVIYSNNTFNLNYGGTFAIATNFDASIDEFNWNSGGNLSVGGNLTGMSVSNNTVALAGGRDLTLNGGTWNTESTNLVVGDGSSGSDLVVTNGGWVNVGTGSTNDFAMGLDGGIAVGGTNGASLLVQNGSTAQTTGGLYVGGTNATLTGSVTVTNGSTLEAQSLTIGNTNSKLNIENGGTLSITGDYNADLPINTNVNWKSGGTLSVGGTLTKSNGLDGVGRKLAVNGGDWTLGGDLTVSGTNNTLSIINGGTVTNNDAYVGYAASDSNNTVSVSGDGSTWVNNGTLYIGSTSNGNSVAVSSGGRVEAVDIEVADGNDFNLNNGGTLAITTNFDVLAHNNFNWTSGGNLSVGGVLTGMSTSNLVVGGITNSYKFLDNGRDLTIADGGSWDTGTNNLYVGVGSSGSDLTVEDGGWVNVGGVDTNMAGGGMLVASTNGAQLAVINGSVNVDGMLYLGLDTNTSGTATILNGGTLSVGDLSIINGSLLDLQSGGTFAIATNFNVTGTPEFNWSEEGTLSVGGTLTGMELTNGVYYLDGGRDLTLDGGSWDIGDTNLVIGYGSSGSDLVVKNNGMLNSGTTYIGWDTNSANNSITIRDGGTWINSGDLWVGYGASSNGLTIANAGTNVLDGSATIGNANTSDNYVIVNGADSLWDVGNNLTIGASNSVNNYLSVSDSGQVKVHGDLYLESGNKLSLASGGGVSVGGEMTVSNATVSGVGTISLGMTNTTLTLIGGGSSLDSSILFEAKAGTSNTVSMVDRTYTVDDSAPQQYTNFQYLALTDSTLTGYGTLDAFENVNMLGGRIDPNGRRAGTIVIPGNFTVGASPDGTVYHADVFEKEWDQLQFTGAGSVNLTNLGLEVYMPVAPTGGVATIISTVNGLDSDTFASTNIEERLLLYTAVLDVTSNDVNIVVTGDSSQHLSSFIDYAATESARAGFNGMKNMVFTRTKQLRRNLVATADAMPYETYLLTNTNAPAGAMGPGDQNNIFDSHIWMQYYSGQGNYGGSGATDAFDLNNYGTTIGADRLVGDGLAVGLNYTYSRSAARADNQDSLDSETYWIGAYGEWVGVDGLYVDALAAYGYSSYDSVRFAQNYEGMSSYRGQSVGGYADVGQYYYYDDKLALSPYMGLHALYTTVNDHNETELAGSKVHVDSVDRNWLESVLGLKLRYRFDTPFGRFQTTGFAEWSYDFIQDNVSSTLSSDGLSGVETARVSPDESAVNVGLGYSWICTDYMEVGVGYNGRYNADYEEHTGSLMLDIMF